MIVQQPKRSLHFKSCQQQSIYTSVRELGAPQVRERVVGPISMLRRGNTGHRICGKRWNRSRLFCVSVDIIATALKR